MNIYIIFYIIIWNLKHHREDNRPIVWMKKMEMSWNFWAGIYPPVN